MSQGADQHPVRKLGTCYIVKIGNDFNILVCCFMCLVFSVLALFLSRILLQEPKLTYIIELTIEDKEIKVTFTQFYIKRNKNDFPSSRLHG